MSINLNRVQNLIEKLAFISCYISELKAHPCDFNLYFDRTFLCDG